MPCRIERMFAAHLTVFAALRARPSVGRRLEISSAMMPRTTSSSTSVKPDGRRRTGYVMVSLLARRWASAGATAGASAGASALVLRIRAAPALLVFCLVGRRFVTGHWLGIVRPHQPPAVRAER